MSCFPKMAVAALSLACLVIVSGVASPAKAALFNFSYDLMSGDTISGQFEGTIDVGDSNILLVDSVISAAFNGVAGPALPYLSSATDWILTASVAPAAVSFDGSLMDILAATTGPAFSEGFVFLPSDLGPPTGAVNSGPFFGNANELFVSANWSLEAVAPVPLPAAFPLLAGGLGLLGLLGWRRKRIDAA